MNDPMFTGGRLTAPVRDITSDGTLIPDLSDTVEPLPIALFEPTRIAAFKDPATGTMHEMRIESLISAGLHRVPAGPVWATLPAEGWGLYRTEQGVVLRDAMGTVWADGTVTVDPAWASAAASYGSVAVLVGPYLCVRTPPGKTPATYTAQEKLEEFRRGRRMGLCTVGSVLWHPTPPPEALNWALFQPAAFGVPWPVAYVPQWNFTPYGGPQALGFTPPIGPPPPEGRHVSIHATTKLIAVVTGTDLDLHRTNQDPDISYITGYHDMNRDGFFTAWQQAAHAYGQILIITGEQEMPCEPGTTVAQAQQVLSDSWTAIVTVHSTLGQPTSDPWDLP